MAQSITIPELGFDTQKGTLANWLKAVGDTVQPGEAIAEIEADKVTLEVPATSGGVLLKLLVQPGQPVTVGDAIALVGAAEEAFRDKPTEGEPEKRVATSIVLTPPQRMEAVAPVAALQTDSLRITPVARRMAEENGLALEQIQGSGPGGYVLKADVQAHLLHPNALVAVAPPVSPPVATPPVAPAPLARGEPPAKPSASAPATVAPSSLRRAIAQRMSKSKGSIPHFYMTKAIFMDAALALRAQINATLPENQKVTVNDLVVKAVALVLREFPNLNASFEGEQIVQHQAINVGIAVAVEGGLLTVVNKNSDRATISTVAARNKALFARARAGKVKPEDIAGATFTISNLGAYDLEHFAPIINPPEAAILGVATAKPTPVVEKGQVVVRTQMLVTLAADHRLTDGVEAAQFLARLKEKLETPLQVVI